MTPGAAPDDATTAVAAPTILIVDDNEPTARALAKVLANAGFATAVFHNGQAALAHARKARPDAALVDIHLPDINGLAVCTQLRDIAGPTMPIVVVSGDTSMANLNALPHVGATYFFSKPIMPTALLTHLKEWLDESRAAG